MSTADCLRSRVEGPIGWLEVDRPESRGAFTRDMWEALPQRLGALAASEGVRVVVVTGTQGNFIAGADITEFGRLRSDPDLARRYDEGARATLATLERLAVPSIALIGGACVGGGCLIAFACDLRIMAEEAALAITAGRLGLAYPYEGLERLVTLIGEAAALDLLLTGRFVAAPEAKTLGLVHDCVPAAALAARLAERVRAIARNAPLPLRYARLGVRRRLPPAIPRAEVEPLVAACFASEDYAEGVAAFLEKRDPAFRGR